MMAMRRVKVDGDAGLRIRPVFIRIGVKARHDKST